MIVKDRVEFRADVFTGGRWRNDGVTFTMKKHAEQFYKHLKEKGATVRLVKASIKEEVLDGLG